MKRVIVGTAGHIDHGKTSLVKALTGVDADRLKEEKQRGITIDIGFADLTIEDVHFGFVDVPGHERFVKNMLAGAHGIDLVLLVVAADESVMPQTREHFDICRLLEIPSGIVALTKIDMAEPEFSELVEEEVRDFVKGSFLGAAPIVRVSSRTGEGIERLKAMLLGAARTVRAKNEDAVTRLPIDRAFTIKGFGSVVTGTLVSGILRAGDELEALPGGLRTKVRGLQVHGRDVAETRAGERTAVNLQNVSVEQVPRGLTLVPAGMCQPASLIDAELLLLPSAGFALKQRARVRVHLGTAEVMARVVILGESQIEPGARALVQLRLESPVLAFPGDRFIIRRYSPQITIGGGKIVDALAAKHRRGDREVIDFLQRLQSGDEMERMSLFVQQSGLRGMTASALGARCGLPPSAVLTMLAQLSKDKKIVCCAGSQTYVSADVFHRAKEEALGKLQEFHASEPLRAGMSRETLLDGLGLRSFPDVAKHLLQLLVDESKVKTDKEFVSLPNHRVTLDPGAAAELARFESVFQRAGMQALQFDEALAQAALPERRARELLQILLAEGKLVKVASFLFHRSAIDRIRVQLQERKRVDPNLDVAAFKDLTGTSRKHAIPLLEYLDAERVTRRAGSARVIL